MYLVLFLDDDDGNLEKKEIGKKLFKIIWDNNTEFTDENIIVSRFGIQYRTASLQATRPKEK